MKSPLSEYRENGRQQKLAAIFVMIFLRLSRCGEAGYSDVLAPDAASVPVFQNNSDPVHLQAPRAAHGLPQRLGAGRVDLGKHGRFVQMYGQNQWI